MWFSRMSRRVGFLGFLIFQLGINSSPAAHAAPLILNSTLGTNCVNPISASNYYTNRYIATSNVGITAINLSVGTGSTANFNSSYVYIFSDDPVLNQPASVLETFTPNSINGSGVSTTLNYVGSRQISSGTKFWIVASGPASVIPRCNNSAPNTAFMVLAGVIPDTSTSNSNTSFRRASSSSASLFSSPVWTSTDGATMWQLSIEGQPPQVAASIGLISGSRTAMFRTATNIRVNVSALSQVTFYNKNRVIPNCRNILSVGGVADCVWKPSNSGSNSIYARVTSLDSSYLNTITSPLEILVNRRTNTR